MTKNYSDRSTKKLILRHLLRLWTWRLQKKSLTLLFWLLKISSNVFATCHYCKSSLRRFYYQLSHLVASKHKNQWIWRSVEESIYSNRAWYFQNGLVILRRCGTMNRYLWLLNRAFSLLTFQKNNSRALTLLKKKEMIIESELILWTKAAFKFLSKHLTATLTCIIYEKL